MCFWPSLNRHKSLTWEQQPMYLSFPPWTTLVSWVVFCAFVIRLQQSPWIHVPPLNKHLRNFRLWASHTAQEVFFSLSNPIIEKGDRNMSSYRNICSCLSINENPWCILMDRAAYHWNKQWHISGTPILILITMGGHVMRAQPHNIFHCFAGAIRLFHLSVSWTKASNSKVQS